MSFIPKKINAPATPLPWKQLKSLVRGDDGTNVVVGSTPKDAEYIVRAANGYPRLVEVVRSVQHHLRCGLPLEPTSFTFNEAAPAVEVLARLLASLGEPEIGR